MDMVDNMVELLDLQLEVLRLADPKVTDTIAKDLLNYAFVRKVGVAVQPIIDFWNDLDPTHKFELSVELGKDFLLPEYVLKWIFMNLPNISIGLIISDLIKRDGRPWTTVAANRFWDIYPKMTKEDVLKYIEIAREDGEGVGNYTMELFLLGKVPLKFLLTHL